MTILDVHAAVNGAYRIDYDELLAQLAATTARAEAAEAKLAAVSKYVDYCLWVFDTDELAMTFDEWYAEAVQP